MKSFQRIFAFLAAAIILPTLGLAQRSVTPATSSPIVSPNAGSDPDVYRVNYFENANCTPFLPDDTVHVVDPGTNGSANLCVDIYVITPDEQMNECCGCLITPDQLLDLSVNNNLTNNPATSTLAKSGVIKIISSAVGTGGTCDPGNPTPTPTLRAWITHHDLVTVFSSPTPILTGSESEFSYAALSTAEESFLAGTCAGIEKDLSGHGICNCPLPTS